MYFPSRSQFKKI